MKDIYWELQNISNRKISYALGLEEILLLKWSCYPKQCRVHAIPIKLSIFFTELEKKCWLISLSSVTPRVWLFVTPWTAERQASLSIANSQSSLKLMLTESVMPSNHLILCCPLLLLPSIFPASGSFPKSQLFTSGGQSIRVSASTSVLPMNIQDWFPLGWTS